MNRFTKLTPEAKALILKNLQTYLSGKMTLEEDTIQLFQDIQDTDLQDCLSKKDKMLLEILKKQGTVSTVRPQELN